ncbi:MAG: polysaccharide pyruvyl transferase family protein [Clostridia bacterium]|nr:polysaccharide pyruvyl transferase family protein [Clostridia bacterium]
MIGVCIRYFHENYGGMLQAFATTKMLEMRGIDYELIRYEKRYSIVQKIKFIPRLFNSVLLKDKKEAFNKKLGMKKHPEFAKNDALRMAAFNSFKKEHFTKLAKPSVGYENLCKDARKYEAVITGSDQLWSPAGLPTNFYNLMFVPDDIEKISIASSFGVGQIPWYQKKRTAHFINRIEHVSMRENRGKEIVKELTGRDVPVVLDPVFLLSKEDWDKYIPEVKVYDEPYIFAYFLGENPLYREEVKMLSKKTGLKIVALRHLDQYVETDESFGDYAPYDVSPDKFLNLIRGAEYICTDSFHGTCFSIINEKKFMIFNRYSDASKVSKNSRIDSLCTNLGISERRFVGNIMSVLDEIDYHSVNIKLNKLKSETDKYLDKAFDKLDR